MTGIIVFLLVWTALSLPLAIFLGSVIRWGTK
jgi:hypothetical protein